MDQLKDEVIRNVCLTYRLKQDVLLRRGRKSEIVKARQITFAVLRRLGFRLERIGSIFGRDHTTAMFGVKRAERSWPEEIATLYRNLSLHKNHSNLPPLIDPDADLDPIDEARYHYLAQKIQKFWIEDNKNILKVTGLLHITLRRFSFITEKYGIKKC